MKSGQRLNVSVLQSRYKINVFYICLGLEMEKLDRGGVGGQLSFSGDLFLIHLLSKKYVLINVLNILLSFS